MKIVKINARDPIVPRNAKDPAGQFPNIRRANRQLITRYTRIKKGLRELIASLDKKVVTNVRYDYLIDTDVYNNIDRFIHQLLNEQLLGNREGTYTNQWWLNTNLSTAYAESTEDIIKSAKLITDESAVGEQVYNEIQSITPESRQFNRGFISRISLVHARVFNEMKGLTESTKTDLAETLARGMSDGIGVQQLSRNVAARADVSFSRAKRIARTEIMNSFRTATSAETDALNDDVYGDSDWHMATLWYSALSPTSRKNHVAKHGLTYTTQQVRDFYAVKGNSINCLCSQSAVLQNKKTGEILQNKLLARMKKQRETYQAAGVV